MMRDRQTKAGPKALATLEQKRDMYGFMVRPQHLARYQEYVTIYKEEEAERSDRWEQFLNTVNEDSLLVSALEVSLPDATDNSGSGNNAETPKVLEPDGGSEGDQEVKRLWVGLRKSLWAIERVASIRAAPLGSFLSPEDLSNCSEDGMNERASFPTDSNLSGLGGDSEHSSGPTLGVNDSARVGEIGNDGSEAVNTAFRTRDGAYPIENGDGSGEGSENETCDATESTEVLREGENARPPKSASVEAPWEEELRSLVRGGVPMALRGELWQVFVGTQTRRVPGHYNTLLSDDGGDRGAVGVLLSADDSTTSSYSVSKIAVHEKWTSQIEKDLPRTFPGHPALDEDGLNKLRRLLTAYARHNPSVGYCQAMNFLAALLLLLMPEENAFWTLTGIIDDYFEGYYSEKMVEAQVDQLVFEDLVRQTFPRLANHLDTLGVEVAWVSGPWFLSIFVNVLPWESVLRVWDVLLYERNRCMLFRTGLALMEIHGPALVSTLDAGDAVAFLQSIASSTFDSSQLVMVACMGFQTVTETRLRELRLKHRPMVLTALQERSMELKLWRDSNSSVTEKLPLLCSVEGSRTGGLSMKKPSVVSGGKANAISNLFVNKTLDQVKLGTKSRVSFEGSSERKTLPKSFGIKANEEDDYDDTDAREQVTWLKNELCQALEDRNAAILRAEELEVALVEMVKEDNRLILSAKVEKLEAEVNALNLRLSDKKEQEQALVEVLVKMEQEQKIADDARRFAELDSEAQRRAAEVFQDKYEGAADALAEMEKRAVMAETMLEATLSYQALGDSSPHGSGSFRHSLDPPLVSSRIMFPASVSSLIRGSPPNGIPKNGKISSNGSQKVVT